MICSLTPTQHQTMYVNEFVSLQWASPNSLYGVCTPAIRQCIVTLISSIPDSYVCDMSSNVFIIPAHRDCIFIFMPASELCSSIYY